MPSNTGSAVTSNLNILTAFLAGLLSFVSPCVLPLIPAYLSFLTGSSVEELKAQSDARSRARTMLHALAFVAGFTRGVHGDRALGERAGLGVRRLQGLDRARRRRSSSSCSGST